MQPRIPLPDPFSQRPFSRLEARAGGLTDGRLRGSDLERPFHGVRSAQQLRDIDDRCRAFMLRMPPNGFFNSLTAAAVMRLPLPLSSATGLHVAVPSPARGLRARGVIGHKVQLMGNDTRDWHGLPISSPSRAFCEVAAELGLADLVAVGDHLIHRRTPLATHDELFAAAARYPGQRGKNRLASALALLSDRAESAQESRLRVVLVLGGLTGFDVNHEVVIEGRRFRVDIALVNLKIAIEYQGDHHRSVEQWRRDMRRRSILESHGWFVIEVNADDLRDARELVARVSRVMNLRRGVAN